MTKLTRLYDLYELPESKVFVDNECYLGRVTAKGFQKITSCRQEAVDRLEREIETAKHGNFVQFHFERTGKFLACAP